MIYTVTVNPAIDCIMNVDGFPKEGALTRARSQFLAVGGKGINVSLMLKTLGVQSIATGFVAGFSGDAVISELENEGLRHDFVRLPAGQTRINVKLKNARNGISDTEINGLGPAADECSVLELFEKLDKAGKDDIIVMSGSILPDMSSDFYAKVAARVSAKGTDFAPKIIADTCGTALLAVLPFEPLLVKPNRAELSELAGKLLSSDDEIEAAARMLTDKGAQNVIVSLGADGAMLVPRGEKAYKLPALGGRAVNPVGAGDSMVAGFAAGIVKGLSLRDSFALGCRAAEATAMCDGIARGLEVSRE